MTLNVKVRDADRIGGLAGDVLRLTHQPVPGKVLIALQARDVIHALGIAEATPREARVRIRDVSLDVSLERLAAIVAGAGHRHNLWAALPKIQATRMPATTVPTPFSV